MRTSRRISHGREKSIKHATTARIAICITLLAGTAGAQVSFELLDTPGSERWADFSLSRDGGSMGCNIGGEIYWWTVGGGYTFLAAGSPWGGGVGMSADGAALIAARRDHGREVATIWYLDGASVQLGSPATNCPDARGGSAGYDVSSGGRVAVGKTLSCGDQVAYAWTARTGLVPLEREIHGDSRGAAVSADGRVVVGFTEHPEDGFRRPAAWRDGAGPEHFLGAGCPGEAFGVSLDGSRVVGQASLGGSQPQAFYWSPGQEAVALGSLGGRVTDRSLARAVSDDGKVVGWCGDLLWGDQQAFLWTVQEGMRSLAELLRENDVVLPEGLVLTQALDISGDGSTVVGVGRERDWSERYWRISFEGPLASGSPPRPVAPPPDTRRRAYPDSLDSSPAELLDPFPFGKRRDGRFR